MPLSNASSLILLARVSLLRMWLEQVKKIQIPIEVYHETVLAKETFDARLIKKMIDEQFIQIVKSKDEMKYAYAITEFRLDKGEAEVYAQYDPKKHSIVITDDAELMKLCKLEGISVGGALAITISLYNAKLIDKTTALEKIEQLRKIGRYRKEIIMHFENQVRK